MLLSDLSHFVQNISFTQETPEIDLAVYQEMWFPVAVVAGVTVILIFLAIVCLVSHSIPNFLYIRIKRSPNYKSSNTFLPTVYM